MTYLYLLITLVWIACAVLSFGISFAYWQREYAIITKKDLNKDFLFSLMINLLFCLVSPFMLIMAYFIFFDLAKHGLKKLRKF